LAGGHVACDGGVSVLSGGRVGASEGRGDKGKGVRVLKGQTTTPAFGLAKTLGFPFKKKILHN